MNSPPTKESCGDQMQSAASRLLAFLNEKHVEAKYYPYEVRMAMAEAQSAINDWTELRKKD